MNINNFIKDRCITATAAIQEIGISRNEFYSCIDDRNPDLIRFFEIHQHDWIFTPDKFQRSIDKSKKTQMDVSERIGLCYATLNVFLKGKQRPTRATGDYDKIRMFCLKWFEY